MFKLKKKQWILIAIMLALTVAVTALVRVSTNITYPLGNSRVNAGVYATLGDACVYAAVLLCGWPWGAIVAAVGAAAADLIVGSKLYIIGSLLVKTGMAYLVALLALKCDSWARCFVTAAVTEAFMVVGYFIFNLLIVREFAVAGQAFLVDLIQGVVCTGAGGLLLHYLPVVRPNTLPKLKAKRRPKNREREDAWN